MKARVILGGAALAALFVVPAAYLSTQPSFNSTTPGCGGGSCHTSQAGIVSTSTNALSVAITLSGATGSVAGELVDGSGTVVAVNNSTSSNPFTLTAPGPGTYTVNAGFKKPNLRWDTKSVTVSTTSVTEKDQPAQFALEQNYPNPFNPDSDIRYQISEFKMVRLAVYDLLGREVAVLVNGNRAVGSYEVKFDATGLPSGVYLYRLTAGTLVLTRKMMLVR